MQIEDKIRSVIDKYNFLSSEIGKKEIISDREKFVQYSKELSGIEPLKIEYESIEKLKKELEENKELLKHTRDKEFEALIKEEIDKAKKEIEASNLKIKKLLLPMDPNDEKNIILEIRSGTGGEEAALFGYDLYRMYSRYAELKNWKIEILSKNDTGKGGIKELSASISGKKVYSRLKFESGTHRVQRVPVTESSGRLHTSAVTVAILPEPDKIDVEIDSNDLRVDVYRSSGAGGQHVNTTDSAVRMTHIPTGIVVCCQDERSQIKNREKAMKILRAKLFEFYQSRQQQEISDKRKNQVKSGDRSEKIRTYNFPQNRVTDHRIKLSLHKLDQILNGDMDELIDALIENDEIEKIANLDEN